MSVLLAGLDPSLAAACTRRLLAQGDQVRVIVASETEAGRYDGAHVASGDVADDDLVERAAQGARTIVLGDVPDETVSAALTGAARAGVDRAVLVGRASGAVPAAMSWVALLLPRPRLLGGRRTVSPDALAEAVDAADDLAGEPRLVVDLGTGEGWRALRLDPPGQAGEPR